KKRKKRPAGNFPCEYPGCEKTFTRSEHRSRHMLNHNPPVIYTCHWQNCSKTFVRNDLKVRHLKRHKERLKKEENQKNLEIESMKNKDSLYKGMGTINLNLNSTTNSLGNIHNTHNTHNTHTNNQNNINNLLKIDNDINFDIFDNINSFPFEFSPGTMTELFAFSPIFPSPSSQTLINQDLRNKFLKLIPPLEENPDFTIENLEKCLVSYWSLFHIYLPILHKPSFNTLDSSPLLVLSMIMVGAGYMRGVEAECANSSLNSSMTPGSIHGGQTTFVNAKVLADLICVPLRGLIFSHEDFSPPAELWVFQSLILLEIYEKFMTSRKLHERSYIHHGTLIQLLRRTRTLGGDPQKYELSSSTASEAEDEEDDDDRKRLKANELWKKWIEYESMNRAAFMAFYMDISHGIIFGHQPILSVHQIRICMPCSDEVWESSSHEINNNLNLNTDNDFGYNPEFLNTQLPPKFKNASFFMELGSIIKSKEIKSKSSFGMKVLMTGLLAILSQLQHDHLQFSLYKDSTVEIWKENLLKVLDHFIHDYVNGCCNSNTSTNITIGTSGSSFEPIIPKYYLSNDTRCKVPSYHLAHITMTTNHYDLVIYAGAPSRMNVKSKSINYDTVKKRIEIWCKNIKSKLSVLHAYLYLFEMLLKPQDVFNEGDYSYKPLEDPILQRVNAMAICILTIWAYNFTTEGIENKLYDEEDNLIVNSNNINGIEGLEDGYEYLRRIRNSLSNECGYSLHCTKPLDSKHFIHISKAQALCLDSVKDKKNMVGLLNLISNGFSQSNWELSKEFSKLLKNCAERSLGRHRVKCDFMYN
ncbi:Sdd4p ASCRUDRAFT_17362, partial [Ascoidea rubescens DSM 1968]